MTKSEALRLSIVTALLAVALVGCTAHAGTSGQPAASAGAAVSAASATSEAVVGAMHGRLISSGAAWPDSHITPGAKRVSLSQARQQLGRSLRLPSEDVLPAGEVVAVLDMGDDRSPGAAVFYKGGIGLSAIMTPLKVDVDRELEQLTMLDRRKPDDLVRLRRAVTVAGIPAFEHEGGTIVLEDGTTQEFGALVSWQAKDPEDSERYVVYDLYGYGVALPRLRAIAASIMR